MTLSLDAIGTVAPLEEALIRARVDGLLEEMPCAEGQEVAQGAVLARIDARPYAAQVRQQASLVAKDRAQLAKARLDLDRYGALAKQGMVAQGDLDQAKAQADAWEATLASDQAAADAARLQEEFTTVRAPFSGRIGLRMVDPGAIIHASDTGGLLMLTQLAPISVVFPVNQDQLASVRAAIERPVGPIVVRDRGGADLAAGTLSAIDNHIDATTGQVRCRLISPNPERGLWPGAFVVVHLPIARATGIAVPSVALVPVQGGWSLFVVDDHQAAHVREVALGAASGGWTIIAHGLAKGEQVVVTGQYRLADDARVDAHPAEAVGDAIAARSQEPDGGPSP